MNRETPSWREDTVFLWDNASYHSSLETRENLRALGLKFIYSGPYSYQAAPIEMLFGGLKQYEINTENESTGKK